MKNRILLNKYLLKFMHRVSSNHKSFSFSDLKVNIAITKAAMEDEVLSVIFTSFVKSLFDYKIIDINSYNKFLYNTDSESKIKLLKSGLSHQVIHFLEENDLMDEIIFNDIGFQPTEKLVKIILEQDDYVKFELNKIIDF